MEKAVPMLKHETDPCGPGLNVDLGIRNYDDNISTFIYFIQKSRLWW